MLISLANLTFPMTKQVRVCFISLTARVIWRLGHYKMDEMKLNLGYLGTSGISTTLVQHLLIELARIQTYTKLCVESNIDI